MKITLFIASTLSMIATLSSCHSGKPIEVFFDAASSINRKEMEEIDHLFESKFPELGFDVSYECYRLGERVCVFIKSGGSGIYHNVIRIYVLQGNSSHWTCLPSIMRCNTGDGVATPERATLENGRLSIYARNGEIIDSINIAH